VTACYDSTCVSRWPAIAGRFRFALLEAAWTFGLILSAAALIQAHASESPAAGARPGRSRASDLEGRQQDLQDFKGSIVVVNFWATWCIPAGRRCQFSSSFRNAGVPKEWQVIGASADVEETKAQLRHSFKSTCQFPNLDRRDHGRHGAPRAGTALPATAIIDRDGTVATRAAGIIDEAGLNRWIDWLLGDRSAPAPPPVRVTDPPLPRR